MCDLCSVDIAELKRAREHQSALADRLKTLAASLRELSIGSIRPHTDEAKLVAMQATGIIRELVNEWL
jgi:hypothetical protein